MKKKDKERNPRVVRILGRLGTVFIVLGICGILLPFLNNYLIRRNSQIDLSRISAQTMALNQQNGEAIPWNEVREIGYVDFWPELGKADIGQIVGELHVPSVGITLPVFNTSSNANLLAGVGELFPDRAMGQGNFALSGHYVQGNGVLLHNLMDAEVGRTIYVTNKEHIYVYRIAEVVKKGPEAVHMVEEGQVREYPEADAICTIMTCYNGKANARWFVVGTLEATVPYDPAILSREWGGESDKKQEMASFGAFSFS